MNIYDQLQAVEDRYEELGELLSDPDVVSDTKRFMELSREEANTRETVATYREYKQIIQNIADAEEMIRCLGGNNANDKRECKFRYHRFEFGCLRK